jgi:hypothetical protein
MVEHAHCAVDMTLRNQCHQLACRLKLLPPSSIVKNCRETTADYYYYWTPERGGNLTTLDRRARRALLWYPAAGEIASWEFSRPFLAAIHAFLLPTSWTPVHAAAVAKNGAAILIAGRGGVGKTTTALVCAEAGWDYLSDDFVLVGRTPWRAAGMYRSARMREDMFVRLPRSMAAVTNISTDDGELRAEVDVGAVGRIGSNDAEIRAIVLPQRAGAEQSALTPIRRSQVLSALAGPTLIVWREATQKSSASLPNSSSDSMLRLRARTQARRHPRNAGAATQEPIGSRSSCGHCGVQRRGPPRAAMGSVAQQLSPFDIIIVDDGSTDTTPDVIRSMASVRARQVTSGTCSNLALQQATGDAVAVLDHDDLWPSDRLAAMVKRLQSDDRIDIVAGQVKVELEGESVIAAQKPEKYATTHRPWMVHSLLIRRQVFDRIGAFDTTFTHGMDVDWYMRAREAEVQYAFVPEVSLIYRLHDTNMTSDVTAMFHGTLGAFKNALDRRRLAK